MTVKILDKNISQPSRTKGTIALIITSYVSIALVIVKGIILVPLYLHYINARLYGAWLATGSIVAYFGLLDFGLSNVVVQRVASIFGQKDIEHLGYVIGTGLVVGLLLSCLPLFLGVLISPWISGIVHIIGTEANQLRHAFILAAFGASLMLAMYAVSGVLIALQQQMTHGILFVIGNILGILCTITLLIKGVGLLAIPVGLVAGALFLILGEGFYLLWFLKKKASYMSVKFRKKEMKDLSLHSAWQFGSRSAVTITRESDNLILAALIDPGLCVIFTLTKRAADILSLLVRYFIGAFLPSLSHLEGEGDRAKFKKITVLVLRISSLLGICLMSGYLFFNKNFMSLWVGPQFFGGHMLTGLFCIYAFFMILATAFYNTIFSKGEIITTAKVYMVEALIRIPLCIVFVRLFGIKGVALAAVLAIIPTSFFMQAKKFIQVLNIPRKNILNFLKIVGLQILTSLIVGAILFSTCKPGGIVGFVSLGSIYIIAVLLICLFLDAKIILYARQLFRKYYRRNTESSFSVNHES